MVKLANPNERVMFYGAKHDIFKLARENRKSPTEAERILWEKLRKFRSKGTIFRRQHPIDKFIVDFYCHRSKLVIEADGDIHKVGEIMDRDEGRTAELENLGLKVIRFTNDEIVHDIEKVIKIIEQEIK
jgi:very-short-patch-repair endonuclease